jgi:anhydro-N-acetylmuramic acid kinase
MVNKSMRIIGLMSGTSADGVNVAIIDIHKNKADILAFDTYAYSPFLRRRILDLGEQKPCPAADISDLNVLIGEVFTDAVVKLCKKSRISLRTIDLIGSHGQTIYHNPSGRQLDGRLIRSTFQIGEPSIIAQRTGITTVADFRPADMAAGGEGAPLVPFADYFLFKNKKRSRAVQNIGGIANVTYLPADCRLEDIIAFDTGPGNMIIDRLAYIISKGKLKYDKDGLIASKGRINTTILNQLLRHPYFIRKPPKSTGREEFGKIFCDKLFRKAENKSLSFPDMLATATAFTAVSIARAYKQFLPVIPDEVILCGGGAHNKTLVKLLQQNLPGATILRSDNFGISCDAREAVAFAILAYATIRGLTNNVPSATGAAKKLILGKIIPAS